MLLAYAPICTYMMHLYASTTYTYAHLYLCTHAYAYAYAQAHCVAWLRRVGRAARELLHAEPPHHSSELVRF